MSVNKSQAEFLVATSEKRLHTREESMSRTSFSHENQRSNSKLEQLDILAAELIDSANAIDKPGETPTEHQAPAILKLAMREEELVSSEASIDYAASYYIEHSESWGEVNYGTGPVQRTNETTVVRETEKKRNDSLEVQDVTDLELDTQLLQSGQSYIVEYESKSGLEEELKQTQPRRRIERRSGTVDIRKVAEERPMEELGYTHEEFTSANTTTTTTTEQQKQQKQQSQSLVTERRETNLEQVRSNGSRSQQGVNKTTYTTNTTWDGTFVMDQPNQQLLTTTVTYEQPCGSDETDEIRQTKVTATEIEVRVEATRPTPIPRKLNASTWDDSFVHENSQEMSQQNKSITIEEDRVRESIKSARNSNEHRDYITSEIKNVDVTELNASMVMQDVVNKEQYEKIINVSNTRIPSSTSPTQYPFDQPEKVQDIQNIKENGTESKKTESIRNDSPTIYTKKRLSDTKTTKSLECMQLEITVCEPTNTSTPQDKSSRKTVPDYKNSPSSVPDFVTTITAKEQCICELCTCGRHRCPHNDFQDHLKISNEPLVSITSYKEEYDKKSVDRQTKYYHADNLHIEGEFIGERRSDYTATIGERPSIIKPQDNLKSEVDFIDRQQQEVQTVIDGVPIIKAQDNFKTEREIENLTTTSIDFADIFEETPRTERRNTYTKVEDEFINTTSSITEYIDHHKPHRTETVKRIDNFKPKGPFVDRPKDDFSIIADERVEIIKHTDNIQPSGTRDDYTDILICERTEVINYQDDHKMKSEFIDINSEDNYKELTEFDHQNCIEYEKEDIKHLVSEPKLEDEIKLPEINSYNRVDRRSPIKQSNNLILEGEFERPEKVPYKSGEKRSLIIQTSNLKLEGEFERPEKTSYKPSERRTPIKQITNLKSEGEFEKRIVEKAPTKGDRADIKKPKDHLKPEGAFEGRPKDDYRPTKGERAEIIKHTDNLYMEGDIQVCTSRDDYTDFVVEERTEVTKHEDNLRIEGEFIDMRTRDDYQVIQGERVEIIRHEDNLKLEGEIDLPEKVQYKSVERRLPIKQSDNLKSEGEFEKRIVEKAPTKGDRADIKKPKDHLKPEGAFEGRPKDDYRPTKGERAEIIKHTDNLYMEGDIQVCTSRDDYTDFVVEERTEVTKHEDNLRIEGEFIDMRTRDDYQVIQGERVEIIRHEDNLKLEGEINLPEKTIYSPVERRSPIKQTNNLKLEGEFDRPLPTEFVPAERPKQKKPCDNLYPEGEFERQPKSKAPIKGERADIKKPQDNLKPEGDIDRPEKIPYKPGERRSPIKQTNNLKLEGEFDRPLPTEFVPAERPKQKKPCDNLYPEGEFERQPKSKAPIKGERADVKKPQDNLKPEGDIDRPEKIPYKPGERRSPIKQTNNLKLEGEFDRPISTEFKPADRPKQKKPRDNLHPEGEFERQPKQKAPIKGERADVKKPQDNLKPEGDIDRPEKIPYKPGERRSPIKQTNNLKLEGEFDRPLPTEFVPAERPKQKKPSDNLHPEGEFERQPKSQAPIKGERADIKKPQDNLKPEGDIDRPEKLPYKPGERRSPIKQTNNLTLEGEFERPLPTAFVPAERPKQKKPSDNLHPEGEFERQPKSKAPIKGERADVKKPQDNLKPEGEIVRPEKSIYKPGERRSPIKQTNNLKLEGEFDRPLPTEFVPAERPKQKKPCDNLHPEGEFDRQPKQKAPIKGEKADVKRPQDNLKPEGEIVRPEKSLYKPGERRSPIKQTNNLKLEGEFDRPIPTEFVPAERPKQKKPNDNLHPEGEFDRQPKQKAPIKGDRADVKRPQDNLKPEGDIEHREKTLYKHGEKATLIKQTNNLKLEGEFNRPEKVPYKCVERRLPIKQTDNLKSEGEFEKRIIEKAPTKGDRAEVKKPKDHLKLEGTFECRSKNDYKSTKIIEKTMPIISHDNLPSEKEFDKTTKSHILIRGDKTETQKCVDNMKMESKFERPENSLTIKTEKRTLIKHPNKSEDVYTKTVADQCIIQEESNLGIEMSKAQKSERRNAIRHSDLRNESDFEKTLRMESTDKIVSKKSYDNMRSETEAGNISLSKSNYQHTSGDNYRTQSFKREDHLRMEGRIETHKSSDDYKQIRNVDRVQTHRRHDNLRIEEVFSDNSKNNDSSHVMTERIPTERRSPIKHYENVKSDREFIGRVKEDYMPRKIEKSDIIRQEDNMQMSGTFDNATCTKSSYTSVHGEHTEIRKHGNTVNDKANEAYQQITQGEQLVSPSVLNRIESNLKHNENKTTSSKTSIYREESSLKQRQEFEKQQEQLKRDYVNRKFSDSKQTNIEETNRIVSPTRTGHKRWNIISSKTDISNTALHRRIANAERDMTNVREFDQVIESNSEKKNQSSLQRSVRDSDNAWASSSYERESRVVKTLPKDNLHVGGSFYHSSEAKSYGNFGNEKVHRVEQMRVQGNVSHITLGDGRSSSAHSSSLYKKEFVSRQKGPCPAALLQAEKAPFKHTRDTPRHKFYMPVVETN